MVAHSKDNTLTNDHRSIIKDINTKQKLSTTVIPRRIRPKKRTKRKLWTLNEDEDKINNNINDTQRLHQNAITTTKDTQNPYKKPKTTKASSKWTKSCKSSRKPKRKRVQISYKDLCDENGKLIIGAIHSSKSTKATNIITNKQCYKQSSSNSTNNDHETLQSKKCHESYCKGKMVNYCPPNKIRSKRQIFSRHRRSKSKRELFEENRQREIAKMIRETFQNPPDSSDDEQQQQTIDHDTPSHHKSSSQTSTNIRKCKQRKKTLDGRGKIVVESRLKTNIESSWKITIGGDMEIAKKSKGGDSKKGNEIIFGVQIVDKRECYTIYGNANGVIKMDGKEIEEGVKLEKGMEILIDIEYVKQPKSMVMMRFTYIKADKLWREESEQIVIDGLIPYSYGVEGDVFVAQSQGAYGTYTIQKK